MTLVTALAKTEFVGLTLWHTAQGYQANLNVDGTGWRVCIKPTPVAALCAVLRLDVAEMAVIHAPVAPPPLPY